MVVLSAEEFEAAVEDGLELVPEEFLALLENVAIMVEDEPPAEDPELLGVYEGVPITERDSWGLELPDRITIFQGPLQRMCDSEDELREEIAITVVHELAHHFGIDDDRLEQLGWD